MLRIRFVRTGKNNQPFFRIVLIDKKSPPRGGKPLESLGFYNPLTKEKNIKKDRILHWISKGAQPSDTVHNLLVKEGILKAKKIALHGKAKSKKQESETEEQKPAAQEQAKQAAQVEKVAQVEEAEVPEQQKEKSEQPIAEKQEKAAEPEQKPQLESADAPLTGQAESELELKPEPKSESEPEPAKKRKPTSNIKR